MFTIRRYDNARIINVIKTESLKGYDFSDQILHRAWLVGEDLSDCDFRNADLSNADLRKANLSDANLSGANLMNAIMIGANLTNANLQDSILCGSRMQDAVLDKANMMNADITASCIVRASLRDTDFLVIGLPNLSDENILSLVDQPLMEGVEYTNATAYPADFNPDDYGAVLVPK